MCDIGGPPPMTAFTPPPPHMSPDPPAEDSKLVPNPLPKILDPGKGVLKPPLPARTNPGFAATSPLPDESPHLIPSLPHHSFTEGGSFSSRHATTSSSEDLSMVTAECIEAHGGQVNVVRYSPDGKFIASGSRDCTVRIWKCSDAGDSSVVDGARYYTHVFIVCGDGLVSFRLLPSILLLLMSRLEEFRSPVNST